MWWMEVQVWILLYLCNNPLSEVRGYKWIKGQLANKNTSDTSKQHETNTGCPPKKTIRL